MAQILKSGSAQGAGTVEVGFSCDKLMIQATSTAVVTINGNSITLTATAGVYETLEVDFDDFTVVSGTVNYICFG